MSMREAKQKKIIIQETWKSIRKKVSENAEERTRCPCVLVDTTENKRHKNKT